MFSVRGVVVKDAELIGRASTEGLAREVSELFEGSYAYQDDEVRSAVELPEGHVVLHPVAFRALVERLRQAEREAVEAGNREHALRDEIRGLHTHLNTVSAPTRPEAA